MQLKDKAFFCRIHLKGNNRMELKAKGVFKSEGDFLPVNGIF
jgi:hypothetical protein